MSTKTEGSLPKIDDFDMGPMLKGDSQTLKLEYEIVDKSKDTPLLILLSSRLSKETEGHYIQLYRQFCDTDSDFHLVKMKLMPICVLFLKNKKIQLPLVFKHKYENGKDDTIHYRYIWRNLKNFDPEIPTQP